MINILNLLSVKVHIIFQEPASIFLFMLKLVVRNWKVATPDPLVKEFLTDLMGEVSCYRYESSY